MNIHISAQYKKRDRSLKLLCSNLQGLLSNYLKNPFQDILFNIFLNNILLINNIILSYIIHIRKKGK